LEALVTRTNLVDLVVGSDKSKREEMIYRFMKLAKGKATVQALPVYERLNIRQMLQFCEDAKTAIMAYTSSVSSYGRSGMQWLRNRVFNLPAILNTPSIKNFKGKLAGKTAVIVGAGPSLEADIHHLRELKKHALIIAAGTTIQSLMHFGIVPHLVVSIDGAEENIKAFDHPVIRDIPLLFAPMAQYKVIDAHDARKVIHFYLNQDLTTQYLMGLNEDDPVFDIIPTVSGNAIQAAIYMGCTEIVLVGQDLSYPDDRMYAAGANHISDEGKQKTLQNAKISVENVSGGVNRTTHGMYVTLRSIEELLGEYPDVTFTNTARYGARIEHTQWEPLENVLERLLGQEVPEDMIDQLLGENRSLYEEERRQKAAARLSALSDQVGELEQQLDHIAGKLGQLLELSKARSDKCIRYMQDIEIEWGRITEGIPFITLMSTAVMNQIRLFDRDRPELEKETNVERKAELFVEILGPLIQAMQACIPDLKEMIGLAIERANARGNGH